MRQFLPILVAALLCTLKGMATARAGIHLRHAWIPSWKNRSLLNHRIRQKVAMFEHSRCGMSSTSQKTDDGASSADQGHSPSIQYFLVKSEPHEFSIQQLKECGREEWDGVRNYAARNHLRQMRLGDNCWFYHSSCKIPAIVGKCRVVRTAAPDATALDPQHDNYDPKSTPDNCRWDSVLMEFDELLETPVTLKELRNMAKSNPVIDGMLLLKRSRLSVMPVTEEQWLAVESLIERKEKGEDLLTL